MRVSYLASAERLNHSPAQAVLAGRVVVQGRLVGVAVSDIAAGGAGTIYVQGAVRMPKVTGAIAVGSRVFVNMTGTPVGGEAGSGAATSVALGGIYAGKCIRPAGASDATVDVLLDPYDGLSAPLESPIADPGNAQAIPVVASGHVVLSTAAAETRTLAVPSFMGQQLLLSMAVDGGDCVVATSAPVNQAGNNRITFNDVGDTVLLVARAIGANLRWSVVLNDGAVLSTV